MKDIFHISNYNRIVYSRYVFLKNYYSTCFIVLLVKIIIKVNLRALWKN